MIPPFTDHGLLPPGRHPATPVEIENRLVATFPTSMTRKGLYDGWMRRREELLSIVDVVAEWIDGSFVTAKRDAGDVDLVTLIRQDAIDGLDLNDQKRVYDLVVGNHARIAFGCDSYLLAVYDESDPFHGDYLWGRGYWDRWWSTHAGASDMKGYLEVRSSQ